MTGRFERDWDCSGKKEGNDCLRAASSGSEKEEAGIGKRKGK